MKKVALLLVLMTTFISCNVGDVDSYTNHILPIESYDMPDSFVINQTYTIGLTYQKPTVCYNFRDVYIAGSENTRTIAIYTDTKDGQACTYVLPPVSTVSVQFTPQFTGTYTFRFYKGPDGDGNDTFEEVQFEVTAE